MINATGKHKLFG